MEDLWEVEWSKVLRHHQGVVSYTIWYDYSEIVFQELKFNMQFLLFSFIAKFTIVLQKLGLKKKENEEDVEQKLKTMEEKIKGLELVISKQQQPEWVLQNICHITIYSCITFWLNFLQGRISESCLCGKVRCFDASYKLPWNHFVRIAVLLFNIWYFFTFINTFWYFTHYFDT